MMHYWPQFLVALFLLAGAIGSMIMDGKPHSSPNINAEKNLMVAMWLALVLGAGGFWNAK